MNKFWKWLIATAVPVVLITAVILAISWIGTCGVVFLICKCFGWTFSWAIGTGIWLMWFLLRGLFNVTVKK